MVRFKSSVRFINLTPVLAYILSAVLEADKYFPEDMVITSVNDSKHSEGSAHYRDEAIDLRCNDRPYEVDMALCRFLELKLGPKFLVLYESKGTPNEHIHVQLRKGQKWSPSQ